MSEETNFLEKLSVVILTILVGVAINMLLNP